VPPSETPLVPGSGPSSGSGPNASDLGAIYHYIYGINFGKDGDYTGNAGYYGDNIGPAGSKLPEKDVPHSTNHLEGLMAPPDMAQRAPHRPLFDFAGREVDVYSGLRAGIENPDPFTGAPSADPFADSGPPMRWWSAAPPTALRQKSLLSSPHLLAENDVRHCSQNRTSCAPPMRSDANQSSVANEIQAELDQSYVATLNVMEGKGKVVGPTEVDMHEIASKAAAVARSDEYKLGFQVNQLRDHPLEVQHSAVLTGLGHMATGAFVATASGIASYGSGGVLLPLGGAMGMAAGGAQFMSGFTLAISGADSTETLRMSGQLDYVFDLTASPAQLVFGTTGLVISGGDVGVSHRFALAGGVVEGGMAFRGDPSKLYSTVLPGVGTKAEKSASALLLKNMGALGSKSHAGSLPIHIPAAPNVSMAHVPTVPPASVAEEAAIRFQESVRLAEATLRAHPHMIQQLGGTHTGAAVTVRQLGAASYKPAFARTLAGNAMEALVNEINIAHPATAGAGFTQVGGAYKIDFIGWGRFEGLTFELTTEAAVGAHAVRPYVQGTPGAMIFTYTLPIF
jgi:hypothetical protein